MNDLIHREDVLNVSKIVYIECIYVDEDGYEETEMDNRDVVFKSDILALPAVDAVPVVRCKDCRYYHKEHVRCNDGTEKDISEFPPEAFGVFGYVTGEYGINVAGQCEIEKNCGYAVDKSVYRQPEDFCSRGERRSE